ARDAGSGGSGSPYGASPRPAFRWRAPAGRPGACPGHPAGLRAGRRAYRQSRPLYGRKHVRTAAQGERAAGYGPGHRHPRSGPCGARTPAPVYREGPAGRYRGRHSSHQRGGKPLLNAPHAEAAECGPACGGSHLYARPAPLRLRAALQGDDMLIDTHCHLDAAEFQADREVVIKRAGCEGVSAIVIPAVDRGNCDTVQKLAWRFAGGYYALGIHPIAVPDAQEEDLDWLEERLEAALEDDRFVGVGEIG